MGSPFHSALPQGLTGIKYIWQMIWEILAEEVLLIRDKEVWDSVEVLKQAELCRCAWGCGFTIAWLLWQKWISLCVLQWTQSLLVLVFTFKNTHPESLEFLPCIPDDDVPPCCCKAVQSTSGRHLCLTTPAILALHIPWSFLKPYLAQRSSKSAGSMLLVSVCGGTFLHLWEKSACIGTSDTQDK